MGIKFRCPECQKKIHVKSYLAGKKGVCPTCGAKVLIPTEAAHEDDDEDVLDVHQHNSRDAGGVHMLTLANPRTSVGSDPDNELATAATTITKGPSPLAGLMASAPAGFASDPFASIPNEPVSAAAAPFASIPTAPAPVAALPTAAIPAAISAAIPAAAVPSASPMATSGPDPLAEDPQANWYVRLAAGDQYGPAKASEMRQWLSEGRILADALVWREGWGDWKRADATFPRFGAMQPAPSALAPPPVMAMPQIQMAAIPAVTMVAPTMAAPAIAMAAVPQVQLAAPGVMMAALPAGMAAAPAMMPVGTLAVRPGAAAIAAPAPAAAALAPTGLAATLASTAPAKEEEASQDTMELLKSVGSPGGSSGGSKPSRTGGAQAPAYQPPPKSNTPMVVAAVLGGLAVLVVVPVLVVVLVNQPSGGGGGGFLGSLTGGAAEWHVVSEPDHGFSAKFPTRPSTLKSQEQTMAGVLKTTRYTSDQRNLHGFSYIVVAADINDPAAAAQRSDEFFKESAENAGKIVSSTRVTPAGSAKSGDHNGRAFTIEGHGEQLFARIFLAGKRRFTVAVIVVGSRKPDAPSVEQFFASFKITDAGTPEKARPLKKE